MKENPYQVLRVFKLAVFFQSTRYHMLIGHQFTCSCKLMTNQHYNHSESNINTILQTEVYLYFFIEAEARCIFHFTKVLYF